MSTDNSRKSSKVLVAAAIGLLWAAASFAGPLRAGAAKVEITPPNDAFPMSAPRERDFVAVHDPVYARALVLDDGRRRAALVGLEVEAVWDKDRLVREVAAAAKVPPANVMVFASHTHSHPLVFYHGHDASPAQMREIQRVREGAVAAAARAAETVQPARIAFGATKAWININNGQDSGTIGPDPEGPSDKTVALFRVATTAGKPLAVMVNYGTHASVMFRSASKDGGYEVSGDIPGAVARLLEGPGGIPVVLFSPPAESDQLALFHSTQAAAQLPAADEGAAGWALVDVQARRLSTAALAALAQMPPGDTEVTLSGGSGGATCPGQQIRLQDGKAVATRLPDVTVPLAVLRINDYVIAGVGGDLATPIGQDIKAAFPADRAMVISMLAGAVGYILPDASYARVTHSVTGSTLAPGCAPRAIVQGVRELATKAS